MKIIITPLHSSTHNYGLNNTDMSFVSATLYLFWGRAISLMIRVFTYCLWDRGSIQGRVIPKTQKMVLDAALLNTNYYKVRIKSKMEKSREWSCTLPYTTM